MKRTTYGPTTVRYSVLNKITEKYSRCVIASQAPLSPEYSGESFKAGVVVCSD